MDRDRNNAPIPSWAPASRFVSITPSDGTDLYDLRIRGVYVGGTGDLVFQGLRDTDPVTLAAVPAGSLLPIMPRKVMAATTATLLVGFI